MQAKQTFSDPRALLTRSIQDSETSIDFAQGTPGSRRERVNLILEGKTISMRCCGVMVYSLNSHAESLG